MLILPLFLLGIPHSLFYVFVVTHDDSFQLLPEVFVSIIWLSPYSFVDLTSVSSLFFACLLLVPQLLPISSPLYPTSDSYSIHSLDFWILLISSDAIMFILPSPELSLQSIDFPSPSTYFPIILSYPPTSSATIYTRYVYSHFNLN